MAYESKASAGSGVARLFEAKRFLETVRTFKTETGPSVECANYYGIDEFDTSALTTLDNATPAPQRLRDVLVADYSVFVETVVCSKQHLLRNSQIPRSEISKSLSIGVDKGRQEQQQ